jgi:hypothetical protein
LAKIGDKKFKRTNIVAGLCGKTIIAPMIFEGFCESSLFEAWFENYFHT